MRAHRLAMVEHSVALLLSLLNQLQMALHAQQLLTFKPVEPHFAHQKIASLTCGVIGAPAHDLAALAHNSGNAW